MTNRLPDPSPPEGEGNEPDFRVQFRDGRMANLWSRPGSTMDWNRLRYPPHHPERNPLVGCVLVSTRDSAGTQRTYAFGRGVVVELPGEFRVSAGLDYGYGSIEDAFEGEDPEPVTIGEPWGPGEDEKAISVLEDTEKVYEPGVMPVDRNVGVHSPFEAAKGYLNDAAEHIASGAAY